MFVVILTPTAFSTGFKVSTVGFNCDIEKCPSVWRRTARALICPVGALSTQQSHIVLYNCVDRIRSDEGSRLAGIVRKPVDKRPCLFGHRFEVFSQLLVLLTRTKLVQQQRIPFDNISILRVIFSAADFYAPSNCGNE